MPPSVHRGRLFVIAAPSGAGKTSLVKALLERKPELHVSISYTTRKMRPTEEDGREYHFVSVADFERLVQQGLLLEYAQVFDNHYGTGRRPVEAELARGNNVVLEIDWQGAQQVRRLYPNCIGIFILPPSIEELERRMRARGQDAEEVIQRRMQNAREELSHAGEFKYAIINNHFENARQQLADIIRTERKKHGPHHR
jgi:guanylate kinase